jgi:enolase
MTEVKDIKLRVIFNSFGQETIEAIINNKFSASSSGGISRSSFEAKVISPYKAIKNFSKIKNKLLGDFSQREFDYILKKYENKLGSILTTSLSSAFFIMEFESEKYEKRYFPKLLVNVLGGGKHSFISGPEIQEFLVIPKGKTIKDIIKKAIDIWNEVREELKNRNALFGLNPETAWLSNISNEEALELVSKIAKRYNSSIGIDFAASSIYKNGRYVYRNKELSREEQIDYVLKISKDFKLRYIEDPLCELDGKGFKELRRRTKSLICGDDLIATKYERLKRFKDSINAVIIKPNQAGTVTECLEIINFSRKNKIISIVSHRSTKTSCTSEAKLSLLADAAKFSVTGIDSARCNELLRIWDEVNNPKIREMI